MTKRFNVGPTGANIVTGSGTYSMAGTGSAWMSASLFVLYRRDSDPCITIVMAQGPDFINSSGATWSNFELDWSDQFNPVAATPDVTVEWHGFAGMQRSDTEAYRIYTDNTYSTVAWESSPNIQPNAAGANVYTQIFNTPGVFNVGQTKAYFGGTGGENGGLYVYSVILQNRGSGACDTSYTPLVALEMTKTAQPLTIQLGGIVTYSFYVCNNGARAIGGTTCSDDFNDNRVSPYHYLVGTSAIWTSTDYVTETAGTFSFPTAQDMALINIG